ncbi:hypothetical protein K458DRAFT_304475, partial [Lentithecium fluviatile CBS 122367]
QNMTRIYSEADVTVIVAAGDDPTYGLPGVFTCSRRTQKQVRLSGITLIQVICNLHRTIEKSTWSKRAWTYQEVALSKRKLIFADSQAAFPCETDSCEETCARMPRRLPFSGTLCPSTNLQGTNEASILDVYMSRLLTYDSDALNACSGILNSLENKNHT